MSASVLIRLRPVGPWRSGVGEGGTDRVDKIFRSDRLYSAITAAMRQLGFLEEWLDATARADTPQVAFSSLFPYQAETLFAVPPRTIWPPAPNSVTAPSPVFLSKIRWHAAEFVPTAVIDSMLTGRPILAEQWLPDPESGCLLRRDRLNSTPFRVVTRTRAAIDRVSQASARCDSFACVEFEPTSGLWCVVRFRDANAESQWNGRVKAAFRLLADTGFGGGRSIGWGQTAEPEFQDGAWPDLLLPRTAKAGTRNGSSGPNDPKESRTTPPTGCALGTYWLLSLYSPAPTESPDWSAGDYQLVIRGGHHKKTVRMVAEGSVLTAAQEPWGKAVDVAPDGHAHAVYRAGFALALRLPEITEEDIKPVEEPSDVEAPEPKPCLEPASETLEFPPASDIPLTPQAEADLLGLPSEADHDLPAVPSETQPPEATTEPHAPAGGEDSEGVGSSPESSDVPESQEEEPPREL